MTADHVGVQTEAGRALLDDLAPIKTDHLGEANSLEWADREAFATRIKTIEEQSRRRDIGVLTYDNGEYDVYVAFFADPDLLEQAVKRLTTERVDYNTGDDTDCDAKTLSLEVIEVVDESTLDRLADLLNESGADIESSAQAEQRRAEEEADRLAEESRDRGIVPSPGQITLDGRVIE